MPTRKRAEVRMSGELMKGVTHVPGLFRYPSSRLHGKVDGAAINRGEGEPHPDWGAN
jgi:hypothetical protein